MSDTVVAASPVAVAVGAEKKVVKKTAGAAKKPSATPAHPPTQEMVDASIKTLKERGGSSLLAIKKYIAATYKVDVQKLAPFIKKYLKNGVVSGKLIQTKGKGASGSFKLSAAASKEPKASKAKSSEKKKAVTAAKKKPATAVKKVTASSGEKKVKKSAATKKVVEKKKTEKAKAKTIKKAGGAVKAKTPKPKAAASSVKAKTAAKPKAVTAPTVKPKKAATAAKKAAPKK